ARHPKRTARTNADVSHDAGRPGDGHRPAVELEDRAVAGGPDDRIGAVARRLDGQVSLVAPALAVAARRRARVVVAVRARRAVRREQVRLHAHPEVGNARADLAARRRARVAVGVPVRRAPLRRALPAGRVTALVALIRGLTDLAAVVLLTQRSPDPARRRARVAIAVRARRAVRGKHVRLHAHPQLGIARADLAARRRACVAVGVCSRRAYFCRALPSCRVADSVTMLICTTVHSRAHLICMLTLTVYY